MDERQANSDTRTYQNQCKRLWKAAVPARITNFAWRPAKNSVPTEETLVRRHIADSDVCLMCNGAIDSWKHALIECRMSKCVWALVDEHMIRCRVDNARLWLTTLQESMNEAHFAKMFVTLWAIWWARRKAKHEQFFQSPLSTIMFISKYMEDRSRNH